MDTNSTSKNSSFWNEWNTYISTSPETYKQQHDFECNLVFISSRKFFKDNKMQFVVFEKFTSAYLNQITRESSYSNSHEKRIARALFVIGTRVA